MTTVEQVAPVDPTAAAVPMPIASRLFGAIAVGVALLSATATFLVLAGLTPIDPVQSVVVTLLAVNAGTGVLLLAIIGLEVWVVIQARRRGHARSRPRSLLLLEHARHHRGFGFRRQCLSRRTCPGHAGRSLGRGL